MCVSEAGLVKTSGFEITKRICTTTISQNNYFPKHIPCYCQERNGKSPQEVEIHERKH
jgi:hypothetical protein